LRQIGRELAQGELVVSGGSGCGKSTLPRPRRR